VSDGQEIEEIRERLRDFTEALREADAESVAREFEAYEAQFTDQKEVRRAVAAIQAYLRRFRDGQAELPDTPKAEVTANLLEDSCRAALGAGVITAATPSLRTQATRKATVAFWAILFGLLVLAVPVGLVMTGFDPTDAHVERVLPTFDLPQGEEHSMSLNVLSKTQQPKATTGVEVRPLGGCKGPLPDGSSCSEAEARLWAFGRLPTYELKLADQAYGLLFSVTGPQLAGDLGQATLLLAATDRTPEGMYKVPFEAAYLGYTPEQCNVVQRLQRKCVRSRLGEGARHEGVGVPSVMVRVRRGDPSARSGEKRLEAAMAEEAKKRAEELAARLGGAIDAIEAALQQTEDLLRKKQWVKVRERIDKMGTLFAPIDDALGQGLDATSVPQSIVKARDRFDDQRDRLDAFENDSFERLYAVLTAPANGERPENELIARVAQQLKIPVQYLEDIYTSRADEIQRRVEEAAQQRQTDLQAAQKQLEARCGTLPTNAWQLAEEWLEQQHKRTRIKLGDCFSPRLKPDTCWTYECHYAMSVLISIDQPWETTKHTVTFNVRAGRVVDADDR
jgi:hypothetical protein